MAHDPMVHQHDSGLLGHDDEHARGHEHHAHEIAHSHGLHHQHDHASPTNDRAFAIGVALNLSIVAVQIVVGILSNSLALLADAGHNFSDVLALGLAWGAMVLGRRAPSGRHTYGWRRSSILAALANAITLLAVTGAIGWEAIHRLQNPSPVDGGAVAWVAGLSVALNAATALLLMRGREHDANLRGAFLHMASDAATSLGVVVAGIGIVVTGWSWLDPAVSLALAAAIVAATWSLLREAGDLALDAVPDRVDLAAIEGYLEGLPDVEGVHDLHVWGMSTTETALTVHLVTTHAQTDDGFLDGIVDTLEERFGIEHPTIQIEHADPDYECRFTPTGVV
ncbi:MAG: cobalt-zinc-cadmium efflux system protein [Chloroflexota bacterium]|nr:cobalt-zinc-cadmium efflux system protein [Chloroflexota bacterium]